MHERLKLNRHDYLSNANIKKTLKTLDKNRTNTIIISDANYIKLPISDDVKSGLNKIFDNVVIEVFEDDDEIEFKGEINFKNNIAGFLTNIKQLNGCLNDRKIKISNFKANDVSMIVGVKDFDLWTQALVKITQNITNNQYSNTFNLIQNGFNSNVEEDIVNNFNGNAVFYLFNDKREMHPMLSIEAQEDLSKQVQKYFTFLQLPNNLKLTEKEINKKTLNILKSKFYPYNLVFGAVDDNWFLLGHQHIIEQYIEYKNNDFKYKDNDFYFYSNIRKSPALRKRDCVLRKYRDIEVEVSLTPTLNFQGEINR
ncbi:MAG: hypothetical protein MJ180_02115 [Candidatus Gastranaerophilales bacterium]|nr:hypothetical protein [Candidatus Gastranaerophilales bacterium]